LAHRRVFAFNKVRILVLILFFIPGAALPLEQPTLDATVMCWGRLGSDNR
jgi:hypothetical protein